MSEAPQNPPIRPWDQSDASATNLALLAALTVFAVFLMGYHPGLEDDAFYLAAIKRNLNPALFPHDSEFFRLQFQATVFDKLIAFSVRISHLPLAWTVLLWQIAAIFLLLHGSWRISRRCFTQPEAQWSAVATIAVLLTLPLPGIAITLADQYLHPRTLATAVILAAIVAVIDRRLWLAGVLLAVAFAIHAIMASFGISFCAFLLWNLRVSRPRRSPGVLFAVALLLPLGWIFEPASDAWRQASEAGSKIHPKGRRRATAKSTPGERRGRETRRFQSRKAQKEIPKLAMMAWMAKATASRTPASQSRRSMTATMAARITAVAKVRG
jgi:hypothetical protein